MAYEDFSNADLRALTRQRRLEREIARPRALPPPIRVSGRSREFKAVCAPVPRGLRRNEKQMYRWRRRQWRAGVRSCYYCTGEMVQTLNHPMKCTVDHKTPLGREGRCETANYAMACFTCNNAKGSMTEAEFRAVTLWKGDITPCIPLADITISASPTGTNP